MYQTENVQQGLGQQNESILNTSEAPPLPPLIQALPHAHFPYKLAAGVA